MQSSLDLGLQSPAVKAETLTTKNLGMLHARCIYRCFQEGQENIEEEMGLAGAAAEDAESEYIRKICECEVVTGRLLLYLIM